MFTPLSPLLKTWTALVKCRLDAGVADGRNDGPFTRLVCPRLTRCDATGRLRGKAHARCVHRSQVARGRTDDIGAGRNLSRTEKERWPGEGLPIRDDSSLRVVEDDAKRVPRTGEHAAHPVADGRAIEAAGTLGRPVACGEDHEFALLGGDRLAARLGARPLLDEQQIAPGVVDTADLFGCGHQPAGCNQQEAQEALAKLR